MRKIMLVVSSLMMIGLMIGMYFYEKQRSSKPVTQKEQLEAQVKEMEQTGPEVLQPWLQMKKLATLCKMTS